MTVKTSMSQLFAAKCLRKLHEKAENLDLAWLFRRNDHQNYHLQFYLNVILFFCIELCNDKDQEQVHKMVPDNLRGLLRELPSLPSQHAILMGWASELPVLVKMNNLTKEQQPHSDDPDFWDVWTRKDSDGKSVERKINWETVVKEWQQN